MDNIKLFEEKKVRSHWHEENETWYFSVIDVIEILTESSIPKRYWTDLKKKLTKEESQFYENIVTEIRIFGWKKICYRLFRFTKFTSPNPIH